MTPNPDDLRRAKALAFSNWGLIYSEAPSAGIEFIWSVKLSKLEQDMWLRHARAIRASDEAAGRVLVPRVATDDMIVAGTEEWLRIRAMEDRAEVIWKAMIAAHEGGGGE